MSIQLAGWDLASFFCINLVYFLGQCVKLLYQEKDWWIKRCNTLEHSRGEPPDVAQMAYKSVKKTNKAFTHVQDFQKMQWGCLWPRRRWAFKRVQARKRRENVMHNGSDQICVKTPNWWRSGGGVGPRCVAARGPVRPGQAEMKWTKSLADWLVGWGGRSLWIWFNKILTSLVHPKTFSGRVSKRPRQPRFDWSVGLTLLKWRVTSSSLALFKGLIYYCPRASGS